MSAWLAGLTTEIGAQLRDGEPAMRDAVLLVRRELGHRPSVAGDDEQRVVAEALVSARRQADLTADLTVEEQGVTVWRSECGNADEAGAPVLDAIEQRQQLLVALGRGGIVAEEATTPQAGRAAQRIDLETRVVRDRAQPARRGVRARLARRVLGERRAVLLGSRWNGIEISGHDELEIQSGEELSIFALLPGIPAPDEQTLGQRRATRCASMSSAMPRSARPRT